jgi:hypothetical protein
MVDDVPVFQGPGLQDPGEGVKIVVVPHSPVPFQGALGALPVWQQAAPAARPLGRPGP